MKIIFTFLIATLISSCSNATKTNQAGQSEQPKVKAVETCAGEKLVSTLHGDFDGDGHPDTANIVSHRDGDQSLQVLLSSIKTFAPLELTRIAGVSINRMSLSLVNVGNEITDGPKKFKLATEAIRFVQCESAASIFVWDKSTKKFRRF